MSPGVNEILTGVDGWCAVLTLIRLSFSVREASEFLVLVGVDSNLPRAEMGQVF